MELYKKTGTNPLSSCLPLLIQMPIFFACSRCSTTRSTSKAGVGLLNETLAEQFGNASLFGIAPLHDPSLRSRR